MQKLTLVSAPAVAAVDHDEFLGHARLDLDEGLLDSQDYLTAAIAFCDGPTGMLGRCLVTQSWSVRFDAWSEPLRLPLPDVQSVVVTYNDADAVEQTLSASNYELLEDHCGAYLSFKNSFSSPSLDADRAFPVSVTMVAGYGNPQDVPPAVRTAIKMLAAHLYDNRASTTEMRLIETPHGFEHMIAPYRRVGI